MNTSSNIKLDAKNIVELAQDISYFKSIVYFLYHVKLAEENLNTEKGVTLKIETINIRNLMLFCGSKELLPSLVAIYSACKARLDSAGINTESLEADVVETINPKKQPM